MTEQSKASRRSRTPSTPLQPIWILSTCYASRRIPGEGGQDVAEVCFSVLVLAML